jgi:hypothetical protein
MMVEWENPRCCYLPPMPESVTPCTNTFCAKKKMIRMGSKARIETAINWLTT